MSPTERLHVRQDPSASLGQALATLAQLAMHLEELDDELRRLSCEAPWSADVPYLLQLPGVGLIVAMTVLAVIGAVSRFESAKKLVGYRGLGTSVHDSGLTHRTGHITKEGRRNCAMPWSKPRGVRSTAARSGAPSLNGCAGAWVNTSPSSPWRDSSWSSHRTAPTQWVHVCGTCSASVRPITKPSRSWSPSS